MKYKHIIYILLIALIPGACTDNFEEMNKDPYQISDESLLQDFNQIGSFFPTMLANIIGEQVQNNLSNDAFVRHLATPTPFVGGANNTTYNITWNSYWGRIYNTIMSPSFQVIQLAEEAEEEVFVSWAKLIRIMGASRLSAWHGPIIYSNFGSSSQAIMYDSEEVLYNTWFAELDDIVATFDANPDYPGLSSFDDSFGGEVTNWAKLANTLRLQLALRLTKVAPELARTEGEKAIAAQAGLISTNSDNFFISLYGQQFHPAVVAYSWNDTRMSASMESILIGYEDNRIASYFEPAQIPALYSDHPEWPYKGIHAASFLAAKDQRLTYSNISEDFISAEERRYLTATETHFMLAEAALRNWAGTMSAQEHYEEGVRLSFAEWGAGGVDEYLANNTGMPLDYNDPMAEGDVNDFQSRITTTVAWDEAVSNEEKLEKIITQKWIASYMNTVEIWVDHRRTGYPKLPYNYKNESNSTWGIIGDEEFLKRMPFVEAERENNPQGVADATQKLGGPDLISTRLWWDVEGPNF
jgi:hypothetical protein